ncbi:MAG: carbon storage regulator [Pirellulales bacterium]|nr:carbon storage regulator [Pirellulales bacterium]
MLVLSRKTDQSIIIDDRITITILEVRGDKIRLGIDAPKEIPVMREELLVKGSAAVTAA